jgi:2-polyprenyl-3-methyl-5-hydroxy-6-metoxy-1,4-benzoquinol methylase
MHAIALAKASIRVSGADISKEMIRAAKNNARAARLDVELKTAGFGTLTEAFGSSSTYPFDLIICLGNSLPHLLSQEAILGALTDMAKWSASRRVPPAPKPKL